MAQSSFETAPTRLNPRQFLCSRNPNREAAGQSRLWHATEKATVVSSLSSGWFFSVKMIHAILVERSHQRTVSFEAKIYKSTPRLSSSVKKPLDCWRSLMAWNRGRQRDCGNLWYVQICPDIQLYAISISVQRQSVKSIGIIDVHWCSLMFIVSLCFCFPTLRSCREDSASSSVSILSESLECHKWCLNLNADVLSVQNALFALSVWDLSPPFRLFRMQCSRLWQYRRPLPCSSNFVKPRAKVEQSCQVTKTTKEVAKKWPRSEGIWHEIHIEKFSSEGPAGGSGGASRNSGSSPEVTNPPGAAAPAAWSIHTFLLLNPADFTPITNLYIKITWNCPCYPLFTFNISKHKSFLDSKCPTKLT